MSRDMEIADRALMECSSTLAGLGPEIQGAVLADLVSTHLAGHIGANAAETKRLRETMLSLFIATVRDLIPINEAMMLEKIKHGSH